MSPDGLSVAIVLSPFALLPLFGWLGARGRRSASLLALFPAVLTAYFVNALARIGEEGPLSVTVPWAASLGLSLAFRFDGLGVLFAALITGVGTLIVVYAASYLDGHPEAGRFQAMLCAFMGAMLGVALSDNVLLLFVFWELTGFTSYLLIGFDHDRREARAAALQALIVTGAGGLALLAAAVVVTQITGATTISAMVAGGADLRQAAAYPGIVCLVLLAAFTKSAQFPFHFWLPNAMQAPTPVSAYLHSATMVKAGVYLVARFTPLLGGTNLWTGALVVAGGVTTIGAAWRAVLETDLKRVLAYSTVSALGMLMLLLGIGSRAAIAASLVYLLAHACYKGALFLVAGAIEHETGTRDVTVLNGLSRVMPRTALAALLAACSMAGLPLFFGFIAKEQLYDAVAGTAISGIPPMVLMGAAVGASALLGAAGLLAGVAPFAGRGALSNRAHEPPAPMWMSPLTLAIAGSLAGIVPALAARPITLATAAVTGDAAPVNLALWHGVTWTLALSAATIAGSLTLFVYRDAVRRLAWPRALGTERIYAGVVRTLDALSRAVAPALQSASLRSYALTIVITAVVLVGTALAATRILPHPSRWTPIAFHEAAIAVLIVAAALSAAAARSNMTAVLSLGAVGYGVSLVYALFGAPDLAMTQFAVETLTVVIFVLVFHQLRGFGDLSSRLIRTRDAIVAGAVGIVIATLVLFIGASGTTSRLSAYFADAAPRLGHGRNVVNVILVDFRGFDTLGEITVLVTVAVGVRALLAIGRERRP